MASPQNQRQQERLARQRGAGTHKIANVGFSIQPLGGLFAAPAAPPPPRTATPPSELSIRRPNRSASRTHSPVAKSTVQETPVPSLPREEVASSVEQDEAHRTPTVDKPASNKSFSIPASSTRHTAPKSLVATVVTPVARGKRTRQPSPGKFLTTLEAVGVARQLAGRRGSAAVGERQKEKIAARQRGAGTHKITDLGFSIQPIARPPVRGGGNVVVEAGEMRVGVVGVVKEAVEEEAQGQEEGEEEEEEEGVGEEGEEEGEEGEEGEGEQAGVEEAGGGVGEEVEMEVIREQTMVEIGTGTKELVGEMGKSMVQHVSQGVMGRGFEGEVPAIPIKSPGNKNKRRKVILGGPEQEEVPRQIEMPMIEPATQVGGGPSTGSSPKPNHKQVVGKPAPLHIPIDEGSGEGEGEGFTGQPLGQQDLSDPGEYDDLDAPSPPKPRKKHAKPSTKPPKQHKPRRGAPREDSSSLTFPVLVHRLSRSATHTLPSGSNRSGVNPIDVINQVSMEMIDKYWTKARSSHERKAIESFKEELGYRFLELTDAVESSIILAARTRQAQKRKAQLIMKLLEVKRQRGRVAVKMDDIRKIHEMGTKNTENQNYISRAFSDIAHTLERGKARQPEGNEGMEGLEALVKKVSNAVTGGGGEGSGLLASVVEFNRFLERAEAALRERRH